MKSKCCQAEVKFTKMSLVSYCKKCFKQCEIQDDNPVHLFVSIEYNGTRYERNYSTNNYSALPNGNDCLDKEENYCFIKWS